MVEEGVREVRVAVGLGAAELELKAHMPELPLVSDVATDKGLLGLLGYGAYASKHTGGPLAEKRLIGL